MMTSRTRRLTGALALVAYPMLIFTYWLVYPAYGKSGATAILNAIDGHAARTQAADVFAYAGAFLAVPASLMLMTVLRQRGSRIGWVGGLLSALGWIAVVGLLVLDGLAVEITRGSGPTPGMLHLYHDVLYSPLTIVLDAIATLHVLGGVLIGLGLLRTRLVGLTAAIVATLAPPLHFVSNVAGVLWVDEATWIALAVVYALVARVVLAEETTASRRTATTAGVGAEARVEVLGK